MLSLTVKIAPSKLYGVVAARPSWSSSTSSLSAERRSIFWPFPWHRFFVPCWCSRCSACEGRDACIWQSPESTPTCHVTRYGTDSRSKLLPRVVDCSSWEYFYRRNKVDDTGLSPVSLQNWTICILLEASRVLPVHHRFGPSVDANLSLRAKIPTGYFRPIPRSFAKVEQLPRSF